MSKRFTKTLRRLEAPQTRAVKGVALICEQEQGRGRIVMNKAASSTDKVFVAFESGETAEIDLGSINIIEATPL